MPQFLDFDVYDERGSKVGMAQLPTDTHIGLPLTVGGTTGNIRDIYVEDQEIYIDTQPHKEDVREETAP